jgi:hypothetical protein
VRGERLDMITGMRETGVGGNGKREAESREQGVEHEYEGQHTEVRGRKRQTGSER